MFGFGERQIRQKRLRIVPVAQHSELIVMIMIKLIESLNWEKKKQGQQRSPLGNTCVFVDDDYLYNHHHWPLTCFILITTIFGTWVSKMALPKTPTSYYSDDGKLYIRAAAAAFSDFHSVHSCNWCYKCHSKSLKQYQCNWCHKMHIDAVWMSNVPMFQYSNVFFFS